jgi:phage protein U
MLMSLGMFVFSLPTLAYQELARRQDWRHVGQSRVGARPSSQFAGPGDDKISLGGLLVPDVAGDPASLDTLAQMADAGDAYTLVTGLGVVLGDFVIDSLDRTGGDFFQDGVARKTDFRIDLHRVDDPVAPPAGIEGDGFTDYGPFDSPDGL